MKSENLSIYVSEKSIVCIDNTVCKSARSRIIIDCGLLL